MLVARSGRSGGRARNARLGERFRRRTGAFSVCFGIRPCGRRGPPGERAHPRNPRRRAVRRGYAGWGRIFTTDFLPKMLLRNVAGSRERGRVTGGLQGRIPRNQDTIGTRTPAAPDLLGFHGTDAEYDREAPRDNQVDSGHYAALRRSDSTRHRTSQARSSTLTSGIACPR